MNDGKFDLTNYLTARFSAGVKATTTTNANGTPVPDNGSFALGSPSLYMAGGLSTNFFAYSELNLGNGTGIFPGSAPALSSAKLGYVTGSENDSLSASENLAHKVLARPTANQLEPPVSQAR